VEKKSNAAQTGKYDLEKSWRPGKTDRRNFVRGGAKQPAPKKRKVVLKKGLWKKLKRLANPKRRSKTVRGKEKRKVKGGSEGTRFSADATAEKGKIRLEKEICQHVVREKGERISRAEMGKKKSRRKVLNNLPATRVTGGDEKKAARKNKKKNSKRGKRREPSKRSLLGPAKKGV